MSENWVSGQLNTKAEKARAIARVGQHARASGWTHTEAAEGVGHEIKHAMADTKPAKVGVDPNEGRMYYDTVGFRTREEKRRISLAPGNDMSMADQAILDSTYTLKELLILKIESLLKLFRIKR